MQATPPFENWALRWAVAARGVPQGSLLAGFLVDLVAGAGSVRRADSVCFPLDLAARALGAAAGASQIGAASTLRSRSPDLAR